MRGVLLAVLLVLTASSGAFAFKMPFFGGKKDAAPAPQGGKAQEFFSEARNAYGSANYSKVIEATTKAIQDSPKFADAYALRGKAHKDMGDLDSAMKDLNRAIELNPHLGEAYNVRAQANEINGEMKKAGEDYKKACAEGFKDACK